MWIKQKITKIAIHTFTQEYHRIPKNTPEYPHITQDYPQRTCEYPWKTKKQMEFLYFPETKKNYQNLIKMITMRINDTISRHDSSYMFKREKCTQKQQIIIAWLAIGKLVEVIKTNLGDQYN